MKNEKKRINNVNSLVAVTALVLFKYAMIVHLPTGGKTAVRNIIFVVISVSALAVLLFTYFKFTSGFSEKYKYASIMLIADPLLMQNLFDVWQALSLILMLFYLVFLKGVRNKRALVSNVALFTALTVIFNPSGVFGYAALIMCSGLIYGALYEKAFIKSKRDAVSVVSVGIASSAFSCFAGGLIKNSFEYTSIYNYIPYERFDFEQIKSFLIFNRKFSDLIIAVIACVPVIITTVCFIRILKTDRENSKNREFIFTRKLVIATICAAFVSDISGFILLNSKASISLLVFSLVILILIAYKTKSEDKKVFTQTVKKLDVQIASHPVLMTVVVICSATFLNSFCGSNTIYYYITYFLV